MAAERVAAPLAPELIGVDGAGVHVFVGPKQLPDVVLPQKHHSIFQGPEGQHRKRRCDSWHHGYLAIFIGKHPAIIAYIIHNRNVEEGLASLGGLARSVHFERGGGGGVEDNGSSSISSSSSMGEKKTENDSSEIDVR